MFTDPDDALDLWTSMVEGIINEHAPWREKRVKHPKQPEWMTSEILEAIITRDKYIKAKDHVNHRIWRNNVVSLIRKAKRDYYVNLIEQNKHDSKKFWKYMQEIDPKPSSPSPSSLKDGDSKLADPDEIAAAFNKFFSNIVTNYLPERSNENTYNRDKLKSY